MPVNLVINVEKEIPKNKSIDGTQSTDGTKPTDGTKSTDETKPTESDSSNKHECGCSKTTETSKIANFVAKYLQNEEN